MIFLIFNITLIIAISSIFFNGRKDIRNPLFIFVLITFLYLDISIIGSLIFDLKFYYFGLIPIWLLLIFFGLGYYSKIYTKINIKLNKFNLKNINKLVLLFCILGSFGIIYQIQHFGLSISGLRDLFYSANYISNLRYAGISVLGKVVMFFTAFLFSASYFGGILFTSEKRLYKLISLLPLLLLLFLGALNGARSGFFMGLFIWIASYYYCYTQKINIKRIAILLIFVLVSLLVPLFYIQILRTGNENIDNYKVARHLIGHIFGFYNGFSIWWSEIYSFNNLTYFKYTFSGIFNLLFGGREVGLFTDYITISDIGYSNIYMMYRNFLEDFSLIGASILFFIVGNRIYFYYRNFKSGDKSYHIYLTIFFSVVLYSSISFMLTYNVILFAFFISWLILKKTNFILDKF